MIKKTPNVFSISPTISNKLKQNFNTDLNITTVSIEFAQIKVTSNDGQNIKSVALQSIRDSIIWENTLALLFKEASELFGPFDYFIGDLNSKLSYLAYCAKANEVPNVVLEAQENDKRITPSLASCATALHACTPEKAKELNKNTVFHFENCSITDCFQYSDNTTTPILKNEKKEYYINNKEHVLIIAYYMPPVATVGALRPSYWQQQLETNSGGSYLCHTITATPQSSEERDKNIHYIPDTESTNWLANIHLRKRHKFYSKMFDTTGFFWAQDVFRYIETNFSQKFDWIIISGNPFAYFRLSELKKELGSPNLILDYRDPFSNSPVMRRHWLKKLYLRFLERKWNHLADIVISVNSTCKKLTEGSPKKVIVIENGYDDRIMDKIEPKEIVKNRDSTKFCYAGSFFNPYRNPKSFLSLLDDSHTFVHIGRDFTNTIEDFSDKKNIQSLGQQSYPETISILKSMDAGMIFSSGKAFETTTKVYDYIACNLDIIIIHPKIEDQRELKNTLKSFPRVFFVEDSVQEIKKFLYSYKPKKENTSVADEKQKYSRGYQLNLLIEAMRKLKPNPTEEITLGQ